MYLLFACYHRLNDGGNDKMHVVSCKRVAKPHSFSHSKVSQFWNHFSCLCTALEVGFFLHVIFLLINTRILLPFEALELAYRSPNVNEDNNTTIQKAINK